MANIINRFDGAYGFLSNFYPSEIVCEGIIYPTVEHAFQAMKTLDPYKREIIATTPTPGGAKRLGKLVSLRDDWEEKKVSIMRQLLEQKFHIPAFSKELLATGEAILIEGNTWNDRFWGVCNGTGRNELGNLLMEIRSNIKDQL